MFCLSKDPRSWKAAQLLSAPMVIIKYISWASNQHIEVISEWSLKLKTSNDAENPGLPSQEYIWTVFYLFSVQFPVFVHL